jgi:uncharacterized protein with HEPN domain
MLDAAQKEMDFARGRTHIDLAKDRQLVLALVKAIEIIGEAAYQCSEKTRSDLPDIFWEDIIGMRHRLVHAYFDIDLDILWRTTGSTSWRTRAASHVQVTSNYINKL